jgi:hypothetical protein
VRAAAKHWASVDGSMAGDNDWVRKYIESRVERGREWRSRLDDHKELAKALRYVRILGRSFRPVSVRHENPCGSLDDKGKKIMGFCKLEDAIEKARSAAPQERKEWPKKPEHQVLAFLIREAVKNELRFGDLLLGLQEVFDELIFITDEFAVKPYGEKKECRADIVALGRKIGRFFPVFIELKNARSLGRLKEQLDDAERLLWHSAHARGSFTRFLSAVSGVPVENIAQEESAARKMLIWPKSPSGNESQVVNVAREDGFIVVDFERSLSPDVPYTFVGGAF